MRNYILKILYGVRERENEEKGACYLSLVSSAAYRPSGMVSRPLEGAPAIFVRSSEAYALSWLIVDVIVALGVEWGGVGWSGVGECGE